MVHISIGIYACLNTLFLNFIKIYLSLFHTKIRLSHKLLVRFVYANLS